MRVLPYSFCESEIQEVFPHPQFGAQRPKPLTPPSPSQPNPFICPLPCLYPLHKLTYVIKVQATPVIEFKGPTCTQNPPTPLAYKDPLSVPTPAVSLPPPRVDVQCSRITMPDRIAKNSTCYLNLPTPWVWRKNTQAANPTHSPAVLPLHRETSAAQVQIMPVRKTKISCWIEDHTNCLKSSTEL